MSNKKNALAAILFTTTIFSPAIAEEQSEENNIVTSKPIVVIRAGCSPQPECLDGQNQNHQNPPENWISEMQMNLLKSLLNIKQEESADKSKK